MHLIDFHEFSDQSNHFQKFHKKKDKIRNDISKLHEFFHNFLKQFDMEIKSGKSIKKNENDNQVSSKQLSQKF